MESRTTWELPTSLSVPHSTTTQPEYTVITASYERKIGDVTTKDSAVYSCTANYEAPPSSATFVSNNLLVVVNGKV